jgi:Protein similar to CwfJ C-terminus 2/Protein similar to CwfJ C-terminus 1
LTVDAYYPTSFFVWLRLEINMLSGIKRGIKKRKQEPADGATTGIQTSTAAGTLDSECDRSNSLVAAQLRASLQAGLSYEAKRVDSSISATPSQDKVAARSAHAVPTSLGTPVMGSTTSTFDAHEDSLTVSDLVRLEKQQSAMSHAEQERRTVVRRNKHQNKTRTIDSDDEERQQLANVMPLASKRSRTVSAPAARHHDSSGPSRNLKSNHPMVDSCWWWYESSRFVCGRMLGLGRSVTLSLAPANQSLIAGAHFYLVPIPHATAWTHCEDDTIWRDLRQFQASLIAMANAESKGVLFWETVLPNQQSRQTRLEAILLPSAICQDAPLYFRSALTEIAEDWGTHQSIIATKYVTKELRSSIPKNFPYFYIEYGSSKDGAGLVQMIESNAFPRDFGADTIAGMMRMDPLRFRSNKTNSADHEALRLVKERWKPFDWTAELHDQH